MESASCVWQGEVRWESLRMKVMHSLQGGDGMGIASCGSCALLNRERSEIRVASHGSHALLKRSEGGKSDRSCFGLKSHIFLRLRS